MNYDNEKLNEVILVLWNDIKGELIPEHEKLTKFAYAINAWTNNQNENVDDCKFEVKTVCPECGSDHISRYDLGGDMLTCVNCDFVFIKKNI